MHKSKRLALRQAEALEGKIQRLSTTAGPEARRERMRMWENRNWLGRQQPNMRKGQGDKPAKLLTAHGKGKAGFTYRDYMVAL